MADIDITNPGADADSLVAALYALTMLKTIPITTGASPLEITPDANAPFLSVYQITSGGTGAAEYIHLLQYPLDSNNVGNPLHIGKRVVFYLNVQTNGADVVHSLLRDSTNSANVEQKVLDGTSQAIGSVEPDVGGSLDFAGATVSYIWGFDGWYYDAGFTDASSDTDLQRYAALLAGRNPDGSGRPVHLTAGAAKTGTGTAGGDVILIPGHGDGAGANGNLIISNLPTSDPHVVNAFWLNSGVLTKSAGP